MNIAVGNKIKIDEITRYQNTITDRNSSISN